MKNIHIRIGLILVILVLSVKLQAQSYQSYQNSFRLQYGLYQYNASQGAFISKDNNNFLSSGISYRRQIGRLSSIVFTAKQYKFDLEDDKLLTTSAFQTMYAVHPRKISSSWQLNRISPYFGIGIGIEKHTVDDNIVDSVFSNFYLPLEAGLVYNLSSRWSIGIFAELKLAAAEEIKDFSNVKTGSIDIVNTTGVSLSYQFGKKHKKLAAPIVYTNPNLEQLYATEKQESKIEEQSLIQSDGLQLLQKSVQKSDSLQLLLDERIRQQKAYELKIDSLNKLLDSISIISALEIKMDTSKTVVSDSLLQQDILENKVPADTTTSQQVLEESNNIPSGAAVVGTAAVPLLIAGENDADTTIANLIAETKLATDETSKESPTVQNEVITKEENNIPVGAAVVAAAAIPMVLDNDKTADTTKNATETTPEKQVVTEETPAETPVEPKVENQESKETSSVQNEAVSAENNNIPVGAALVAAAAIPLVLDNDKVADTTKNTTETTSEKQVVTEETPAETPNEPDPEKKDNKETSATQKEVVSQENNLPVAAAVAAPLIIASELTSDSSNLEPLATETVLVETVSTETQPAEAINEEPPIVENEVKEKPQAEKEVLTQNNNPPTDVDPIATEEVKATGVKEDEVNSAPKSDNFFKRTFDKVKNVFSKK